MDAFRLQVVGVVSGFGFEAGWQVCAGDHQCAPLVVGRYAQGQDHVAAMFVDLCSSHELGEPIIEEDGDALEGRLRRASGEECVARCERFGIGQLADACFLQGDYVGPVSPLSLGEEASFCLKVALYILLQDSQRARFCGHYSREPPGPARSLLGVVAGLFRGACFLSLLCRGGLFRRSDFVLSVGWRWGAVGSGRGSSRQLVRRLSGGCDWSVIGSGGWLPTMLVFSPNCGWRINRSGWRRSRSWVASL